LANAIGLWFLLNEWNFLPAVDHWRGTRNSGHLVATTGILLIAWLLARWRRPRLTGTELALYWCGSALPVGLFCPVLFFTLRWSFFDSADPGPWLSGMLVGTTGVLLTAWLLIRRRGVLLTGWELAVYWLGSALPVGYSCGPLFSQMGVNVAGFDHPLSGWLVGSGLAIVSGAWLRFWWKLFVLIRDVHR